VNDSRPSLSIIVDVTNPGQFFACCGLLELAHRLWPGAGGWFENGQFMICAECGGITLRQVSEWLQNCELIPDDPKADDKTCPLRLRQHAVDDDGGSLAMRLDWWLDDTGVGGLLKTWAGQQRVKVIARAMLHSAIADGHADKGWLDRGRTASLPELPGKVVEPFYFDARRFAHALDTGFSLDVQGVETVAHPAVELLCLIGLQRFRPRQSSESKWAFEYWTWPQPLSAPVAAAVACGAANMPGRKGYRFSLRFRDDQKRYKAFDFAIPIGGDT